MRLWGQWVGWRWYGWVGECFRDGVGLQGGDGNGGW